MSPEGHSSKPSADAEGKPATAHAESGRPEPTSAPDEREEGDIEPRSTEAPKTAVPRIERYKER